MRALGLLLTLSIGCQPAAPEPKPFAAAPSPVQHDMPVPTPPRVRRIPPTAPLTRLVVVLHGVGADADDLMPVARALAPALAGAEWLSPDGFEPFTGGGAGRQWFSLQGIGDRNRAERVKAAGEQVARWIDVELHQRKLGWDQLALVGFSQGSMIAHWLAVHRHPAAVVAFSGRFADEDVAAKTRTPVLIVHGTDDSVIPVSNAEAAKSELEARGARVTVRIHPGLAHGIDALGITEAREFLLRELP
jgi:phospholipase/carboxylesterase